MTMLFVQIALLMICALAASALTTVGAGLIILGDDVPFIRQWQWKRPRMVGIGMMCAAGVLWYAGALLSENLPEAGTP